MILQNVSQPLEIAFAFFFITDQDLADFLANTIVNRQKKEEKRSDPSKSNTNTKRRENKIYIIAWQARKRTAKKATKLME